MAGPNKYTEEYKMKIATIEEALEKFGALTQDNNDEAIIASRKEELSLLTQEELINMIISYEKRRSNGIGVGELAKAILQDEDFITLSNSEVAEVCRTLIPGSNTSAKSIASYISKKRIEWGLPTRVTIRRAR